MGDGETVLKRRSHVEQLSDAGSRDKQGQEAEGVVKQTGSRTETWRTPRVKQVLSREEVAVLLQGLSGEEPDHQILEPGPAKERRGDEGRRGRKDDRAGRQKGLFDSPR